MQDDLIVKSSRVLGFKATSETVSERISDVIEKLVVQRKLERLSNGMIDLNTISNNIELRDGQKLNDINKTLKTNKK
jgi:chromosome condensin MukBEF complex kleisin-like MukF subunit